MLSGVLCEPPVGSADDENPIIVVELEFVASFHWALNTRFDCL